MKLHIECLQEKLDNLSKEHDKLKQNESQVESLKKEVLSLKDVKAKILQD